MSAFRIGAIVAYDDHCGNHGLSSWLGDTVHAMVRLDCAKIPPIGLINDHVIEARPMGNWLDSLPAGWVAVIAFKAPT